MDVTIHADQRTRLDARRAQLLDRLTATLAELPDALTEEAGGSSRSALCARMAGDFEAAYVEQAWELLEGKPPLLASFEVAQRKVRAAGIAAEGDSSRLLTAILRFRAIATEAARLLRTNSPPAESADPEYQAAEVALIASIVAAYSQITATIAGWFGDAELRAKALGLNEHATMIDDRAKTIAERLEDLFDATFTRIGVEIEHAFMEGSSVAQNTVASKPKPER